MKPKTPSQPHTESTYSSGLRASTHGVKSSVSIQRNSNAKKTVPDGKFSPKTNNEENQCVNHKLQ